MPKIKVLFLSLLVDIVGKEEISLSFSDEMTIKDILVKLKSSIGKSFEENIFNSENILNKYIIIGLNGEDIRKFDDLDTIIKDGDELSFLPAIAGG
ncbi:MAG: MoaD/ThiS family protein [Candidatus Hermodarchaeota archaeon]